MGEGRSSRFAVLFIAGALSLAVIIAALSLGSFKAVSNLKPYLEKDTGNKSRKLSETDAVDVKDNTHQDTTYFFLKAMAVVFIAIVVFYLIKSSIITQRRILHGAKGDAGVSEDRNNVSFVVDTFHSMVSTLKEKEKELKELKELAEERAKSIEAYNENILKSIQSGVMTFDRQGIVVTSNAASSRNTGDYRKHMHREELFGDVWPGVLACQAHRKDHIGRTSGEEGERASLTSAEGRNGLAQGPLY